MHDIIGLIKNDYKDCEKSDFLNKIYRRIDEIVNDCNRHLSEDRQIKNSNDFYNLQNNSYTKTTYLYQFVYGGYLIGKDCLLYELMLLITLKLYIECTENIDLIIERNFQMFYYLITYGSIQKEIDSSIFGKIRMSTDKIQILKTVKDVYNAYLEKINCKLFILNFIK